MKRWACLFGILLLLACTAGPALAADPQISDVPAGHWAYQAVKKLVSQGYLGLYPDNTFRGDQPVDRFTLAVLVARLLSDSVAGKTALSKDDADLLRTLTGEFRTELAAIASRTTILEASLAQYQRDRAAMSADMAAWRDENMATRESLAKIAQDIVDLKERVAALEKKVDDAAKQAELESAKAEQAQAALTIRVDGELIEQQQRIEALEKQMKTWKWIAVGLAALATVLSIFGIAP